MVKETRIIYFVTGNSHKFREVLDLFTDQNCSYFVEQRDLNPIEIQAQTLKEVAQFKLKSIKHKIDGSFFIEDAGFFVDVPLNGFPGIYSSYVLKSIGNEGILKLINNYDSTEAHFSAIIALYFYPLDKVFFFEGEIKGKVSKTVRGKGGFGFDPIFIPENFTDKTFAEIPLKEKNKISHRGQALLKLIQFLKQH
ncbi:MAG: RdgB/HAM1 family non-canonical purine NTP pyrophosphatase [Candidatus Thorarchaeota archaeon]